MIIGSSSAYYQKAEYNQYKGEIIDSNTKKPLVFASLSLVSTNITTITNAEGKFSLKVPKTITSGKVLVNFLGYTSKTINLEDLKSSKNKIMLSASITELSGVDLSAPKNAKALVMETLAKKGQNYFQDPTLMTAFYRETIKKRRKNLSLSEAVVNIYKTPYSSLRKDAVQMYKSRKSSNYSKKDTLALKLQGGPFNALYVDLMKYPDYIFHEEYVNLYQYTFDHSTRINNRLIYVVNFKQYENVEDPMFQGKLYIDAEKKILTSAIFTLNITDKTKAARLFVRKKPKKAKVWPTEVAYRVDYREKNDRWYYGYSNAFLEFKVDWDDKLFNSVYSMNSEMAVTNWEQNEDKTMPKGNERMKTSIIMSEAAVGFSDPDFWGEYNIIEPEKSIESAIKKIKRQLKKTRSNGAAMTP